MKRLLLFCDGTAMDADNEPDPDLLTNIAKLSRAMEEEDKRGGETVEQIKFYQSGVGTDEEVLGDSVSSALGRGMLQKVKDLYDFLCLNWAEGDEIFLFGFSRGGYTVRLLASLINIISILSPPHNMHLFPSLFAALDANRPGPEGPDHGPHEEDTILEIRKVLKPLSGFRARQQKAVAGKGKGFLIKAVCVFDTVATRGRPSLLRPKSYSSPSQIKYNSFGVDQTYLEPCVEIALQALAVDERRVDYKPVLWERDVGGEAEKRGQVLKQVWFSGAHCDIGGGYKEQDLSYLSLTWLVSELQDHLAFNFDYLQRITGKTVAEYGKMAPHQSRVGTFRLAAAEDRDLPNTFNPRTNEFYHPSILSQPPSHIRNHTLRALLAAPQRSSLFVELKPVERELREHWATPGASGAVADEKLESEWKKEKKDRMKREVKGTEEKEEDVHTDSDASPPPSPTSTVSTSSSIYHAPFVSPAALNPPGGRPSSVTSFTDNESSPPPSPSSSSSPLAAHPFSAFEQHSQARSRSPVDKLRGEWRKIKREWEEKGRAKKRESHR